MIQPGSQPLQGDLLVVDDDLPSLRALSSLLAVVGYQVRSARDGSAALMMAEAEPPDLILLDIQMPGMDGFQVCTALKSNVITQGIPVLFISAGDEIIDKVKGFEVGGVDYVTKPVREEEVLARIKTHLTISKLNATLRETNVHLRDEIRKREQIASHLQRRLEEFSAMHSIAKTLTANQALPYSLETISATICDLFGARLTVIALLNKDSTEIEALVGCDHAQRSITYAAANVPLDGWPGAGQAILTGKAQILDNLQVTPLADPVRVFVNAGDVRTALVIPLQTPRKAWALLLVGKGEEAPRFSEFEIVLAETIAADIAAAIENDQLALQARQAAIDAERQRLARELHDSVSQSIYSLMLLSSGWESMSRQGTLDDPAGAFHRLGEVGLQALRDMRLLIHQLRPSILAEEGLVRALEHRLESVELRANINARLMLNGYLKEIPQKTEDELYKIAQEALNNSLRHSRASQVWVYLSTEQGWITLTVKDDGQGFDLATNKVGMGLRNMRERAESIAGTFAIQSEPGGGTQVSVMVPLGSGVEK